MLLASRPSDGVLLLTLNRPASRNALATPLLEMIARELMGAADDDTIRCVVLAGNEKVFAAGADLGELERSDGKEPIAGPRWNAWACIAGFPKPLVAAVEGWCLGAGCELMLRCDIVVAAENARIGQPETNLGIIPGAGGTALLPRLVGRAAALDMVLTGEPIHARRAYDLGLIARLARDGEALSDALTLASKLASRAPRALKAAKASIRDAADRSLSEHLCAERQRFLALLAGPEKAEGIAAFRERRDPVWPAMSCG
ncbi:MULTISPECIES: enoyl-CoA hydratase-related protein [Sphingomonadaceae]|jgi:enoyl-CoA hydratase|uniref:enoyl-CoA hydratase-related protein n=1 Tax=Sphingomonadales TaxID=204457 RepID=UPI000873169A|nr:MULTISPECIES: enoyl-CoA hydratase-related protein [Sphingomonadaceae]HCW60068.1 2,3-dehydroadipyl-CoA hydratase [Sphingobium sp.]MBN8812672.1 enoyl-CoA hydratase/isomerase family protein [Sphingomonas sp.]OJY53633.1 MAG: 2,3-dehydroadipyl-CoA hydratase [Sphingomonas sp. 67-41]RQW44560.1 2,3-dehydroadipyl-CoA hydratase [Novosphingobium sp. LASN5T]VVT18478.1 enoyl-CoA hydratase-isomerase [Sphingomonas sp. EC-HK361]|tara:strand:- start:9623 stop:10396 length:774 start_codon:yes stop_codon:yes gene_type:complete